MKPLSERVQEAIALLEELRDDRGLLAEVEADARKRLLTAAGQVNRPGPRDKRKLVKAHRRKRAEARKHADQAVLSSTGIRQKRSEPVYETPLLSAAPRQLGDGGESVGQVHDERVCYVCKARFRAIHHFYDAMCPPCAELNWAKRNQTAELSGRVALVTGARVKIGYQAAIMLLRAGCHVVVTTRFARDAAARYAREADFAAWRDRLEIHGIDLRHTPSVERFAGHLCQSLPRLDFILNNACQTVRRPPGFYAHLSAGEASAPAELPAAEAALVRTVQSAPAAAQLPAGLMNDPLFPAGKLDQDLQQVDLRDSNSWRLGLSEVSAVELLEVQLVNAVAPFILNARLRPLMTRVPSADKHIVNVSAMEGQFYRRFKTDKHPHTNMAKAALNMMTRTSAPDYVRDGIHMNSVDTGWVTDEDPVEIARRKTEVHGFHPPLDIVDGAARICDPIFAGMNTGQHMWGLFLKDYRPTDW